MAFANLDKFIFKNTAAFTNQETEVFLGLAEEVEKFLDSNEPSYKSKVMMPHGVPKIAVRKQVLSHSLLVNVRE